MPDNGAGTYSLPQPAFTSATTISSAAVNSDFSDIATALNARLAKNGENSATNNLPMAGFRHTNVGNASSRTHYAATGQVQDSALIWGGTSTGSANVHAFNLSPGITAYAAGQRFAFLPNATNTSTATLAVSGLTSQAIKTAEGADLVAGDLRAGCVADVIYDGTNFRLLNTPTGWARLGVSTISSASLVGFVLPAGYTAFRVVATGALNAAGGGVSASYYARVSYDNGATYAMGASDYLNTGLLSSNAGASNFPGTLATYALISAGTGGTEIAMLDLTIDPGGASRRGMILSDAATASHLGDRARWVGASTLMTAGRATDLLIAVVNYEVTAGTFTLFGMR